MHVPITGRRGAGCSRRRHRSPSRACRRIVLWPWGRNDELMRPEPDGHDRGPHQSFAERILMELERAGVQQAHREDRISCGSITRWPGDRHLRRGHLYVHTDRARRRRQALDAAVRGEPTPMQPARAAADHGVGRRGGRGARAVAAREALREQPGSPRLARLRVGVQAHQADAGRVPRCCRACRTAATWVPVTAVLVAACATGNALRQGEEAARGGDWESAAAPLKRCNGAAPPPAAAERPAAGLLLPVTGGTSGAGRDRGAGTRRSRAQRRPGDEPRRHPSA